MPDSESESPGVGDLPHDRLCSAASALYYAIAMAHAYGTGRPVKLPELIWPRRTTPCLCSFSEDELGEAERFLTRLGIVRRVMPRDD